MIAKVIDSVDRVAGQVADAVQKERRVWVQGPVGSGRHSVAHLLGERLKGSAILDLLDGDDADSPAAALLEIAVTFDESTRKRLIAKMADLADAAQDAAEELNRSGRTLVVLLPRTWLPKAPRTDELPHFSRRMDVTGALSLVRRCVWLTDPVDSLAAAGIVVDERFNLGDHRVGLREVQQEWGDLSKYVWQLEKVIGDPATKRSPLVWRLAIGALSLSVEKQIVGALCGEPTAIALPRLTAAIEEKIRLEPLFLDAVRRALQARRPLPSTALLQIAEAPQQRAAVLSTCLSYGEPARLSPQVRTRLASLASPTAVASDQAHLKLAKYYQTLDGKSSAGAIDEAGGMQAWVERVHHLGQSGAGPSERWSALDLPSPEFYWDRGRFLSQVHKDYRGAADVYLACLKRFDKDDYSRHYAAWNLEKADETDPAVRIYYADAVKLRPRHTWWHRRYISHLIRKGLLDDARDAWRNALESLDPDGSGAVSDPILALQLHFPVAKTWLEAGHWWEARRILDSLPPDIRAAMDTTHEFMDLASWINGARDDERAKLVNWLSKKNSPHWNRLREIWDNLVQSFPALPTPAATTDEDGGAVLAWSLSNLYVQIEVSSDQKDFSWYAKDPATKQSDGATSRAEADLPSGFLSWIGRLAHA